MWEHETALEGLILLAVATAFVVFLLALGGAGTFGGLVLP